MVRICTGEVWVRSTMREPSGFCVEIESVVLLPRRMLGRDVERGEIVEVVLDVRALGDREAEIAPRSATISSHTWLTGWMVPWRSGRSGKRDIDLLDAEPRFERRLPADRDLRAAIASQSCP